MIRVDRGAEIKPGVFKWSVASLGLEGQSRQPLLDACRQIQRAGADTKQNAGLFREGRAGPDIWCSVHWGAMMTVSEPDKGRPTFVKFVEWAGAKVFA